MAEQFGITLPVLARKYFHQILELDNVQMIVEKTTLFYHVRKSSENYFKVLEKVCTVVSKAVN